MTAFKISQFLYRVLLRLHPFSFRSRFEDEMLWVFEEQARHEHLSGLLFDGLRSLLIQHVRSSHEVEPVQTGFMLEIATSSLSSRRMLQAALGATALTLGFAVLLAQGSPLLASAPRPLAVRNSYPSFCEAPISTKHAGKDRLAHRPLLKRSK